MTASANGNSRALTEPLMVVRVEDAIDPALTGRAGTSYQSPPQSRQQAITRVWLLLGRAGEPLNGEQRWVAPIAGGRRVVTLTREPVR